MSSREKGSSPDLPAGDYDIAPVLQPRWIPGIGEWERVVGEAVCTSKESRDEVQR